MKNAARQVSVHSEIYPFLIFQDVDCCRVLRGNTLPSDVLGYPEAEGLSSR